MQKGKLRVCLCAKLEVDVWLQCGMMKLGKTRLNIFQFVKAHAKSNPRPWREVIPVRVENYYSTNQIQLKLLFTAFTCSFRNQIMSLISTRSDYWNACKQLSQTDIGQSIAGLTHLDNAIAIRHWFDSAGLSTPQGSAGRGSRWYKNIESYSCINLPPLLLAAPPPIKAEWDVLGQKSDTPPLQTRLDPPLWIYCHTMTLVQLLQHVNTPNSWCVVVASSNQPNNVKATGWSNVGMVCLYNLVLWFTAVP